MSLGSPWKRHEQIKKVKYIVMLNYVPKEGGTEGKTQLQNI